MLPCVAQLEAGQSPRESSLEIPVEALNRLGRPMRSTSLRRRVREPFGAFLRAARTITSETRKVHQGRRSPSVQRSDAAISTRCQDFAVQHRLNWRRGATRVAQTANDQPALDCHSRQMRTSSLVISVPSCHCLELHHIGSVVDNITLLTPGCVPISGIRAWMADHRRP